MAGGLSCRTVTDRWFGSRSACSVPTRSGPVGRPGSAEIAAPREPAGRGGVGPGVRTLTAVVVVLMVSGCAGQRAGGGGGRASAPLRGFGVRVDQAVSDRLPMVHLRTCGAWGCHEQDVPLSISGPTSAAPCGTGTRSVDSACGPVQLPGPGPGYGYAPVPGLTEEAVTVTVTTPRGAPLRLDARVRVQPHLVCPAGVPTGTQPSPCAGGAPQAQLRIAADGTVHQSG
jgi:hypothetical protein